MRIKKLEICGFKSFADRARLHFGEGITGVVGPNGCGKSNVVDAVRWCMGEQSAKHLRGRGMQDVIFGGSQNRSAQSMAEVTLVFDNDGNVPPAYLNFSEIAVTRRLFRDGSSEYLINRSQVRLRDVTDLFLGTGVGTRAYSIIEQGRIGFVVNSKPEERRTLIEEVAGITKFKLRKKAALRRMESTEQNLARVTDVVSELERQLASLRRQAHKAERYRDLRARLREAELHQATLEFLRISGNQEQNSRQLAQCVATIGDSQRDTGVEEEALQSGRSQLVEAGSELATLQQQMADAEAAAAALARDVEHAREQQAALAQTLVRAHEDGSALKRRIEQGEAEAHALLATLETLSQEAGGADEIIAQHGERVHEAAAALDEVEAVLDDLRGQLMAHHRGLAERQAELKSATHQLRQAQEAMAREHSEHASLKPRHAAQMARQADLERQSQALTQSHDSQRQERDALRTSLPEARKVLVERNSAAQKTQAELNKKNSRRESLKQIVGRLEGYSDGVRHLWRNGKPVLAGLKGPVAEVLEVPSAHERAIETALGERLQYLLVQDPDVATQAMDLLEQKGAGRSGFVPPALATVGQLRPTAEHLAADNVIGAAIDLVSAPQAPDGLVAALLGHVVLVDDWQAATQQAATFAGAALVWVTPTGQSIDGAGVACGGAETGAGLLATRREIRDLDEASGQLEAIFASQEQLRAEQAAHVAANEGTLVELEQAMHRRDLEMLKVNKDTEACRGEGRRLSERLAQLEQAIEARTISLDELQTRTEAQQGAFAEAQTGHESLSTDLAEAEERRTHAASKVAAAQEAQTAARVMVASAKERRSAAQAAQSRLAAQLEEWQARRQVAADTLKDGEAKTEQTAARLACAEADLAGRHVARDQAKAAHQTAKACYDAAQSELTEREQALRSQRQDEDGLKEQLMEARLTAERLCANKEALVQQVQERHDLALEAVLIDYHNLPMPTAEAMREQGELERQLKAMGSINLTAIEECRTVEERYNFLVCQRDDLEEALGSLRQAIQQINRTSRERFTEAFEAVNKMFAQVYPRLFRGGEARLELTHADDVLEAGVEIIASPPGKRLQSVNLLSGGEKALTATALVFAIFLIKPSPFCILDEVDAPLDEANVGRFNEMLRDIAKVSQFIVITHNKQTMLEMDRLYGITMEQPGMSKVVAVDLQEARRIEAA